MNEPSTSYACFRASLAALAALAAICLASGAEASGRGSLEPSIYAPAIAAQAAWGGASALASEAARYIGSGKFTALPGAWCADAVNVWLRATGHRPLGSRMAGAALTYGPRSPGHPGDLAVFIRHGHAYHVGIVAAERGNVVEVISGNWSHRVARAMIPRQAAVYIRT
jgi:hypothetical protein